MAPKKAYPSKANGGWKSSFVCANIGKDTGKYFNYYPDEMDSA